MEDNGLGSSNPVYLITGGLGGVGYSYADYLTQKERESTIILLGRTKESKLREDYRTRLAKISKTKHNIIYSATDIGSKGAVDSIKAILSSKGISVIDMVLHSAGVGAKSAMKDKTPGDIAQVIGPKVLGIENLLELAASIKIERLVSCYSLTSIIPFLGNMEYTAANLYLDELRHRAHPNVKQMLAINLNQISNIGMAVDFMKETTSNAVKTDNSVQSNEFILILENLIRAKAIKNITLSRYDIDKLINENIESLKRLKQNETNIRETVKITEENYTETEFKLAKIWSQVLGIEEIGIHANFFELGGPSLVATQVVSKINIQQYHNYPKK